MFSHPRYLALFIVRFPEAPGYGTTCFAAIDLATPANEFIPDGGVIQGCYLKGEWRKEALDEVKISRVHSPRHGFLYETAVEIGMSPGDLLTNDANLINARVKDLRFRLREVGGRELELSEEDPPMVIRGQGFIGVCDSWEKPDEGRFFLFHESAEVSGPITVDWCEFSTTIVISVRHD